GDRAIDQPRVVRRQALVVEAELRQPAYLEVLDQHVRAGGELAHDPPALVAFEVQLDRALAAVGGVEVGGPEMLPVGAFDERWTPAARIVAGALALDLDDVGPEIGQALSGPGTGKNTGKLEHAETGQGTGH